MITYICHAFTKALSVHMIHSNLNTRFYTHVEHDPTKTSYIRYYVDIHTHMHVYTHTHTHTHTATTKNTVTSRNWVLILVGC